MAGSSNCVRVRGEMATAVQAKPDALPNVCQRRVAKTNPKGAKTECLFTDGTSILLSNFLAYFIRAGDELLFAFGHEAANASTEIYVRHNPRERRQDVFQVEIGYASQPRKDKRDNLFVSAEVRGSQLGISAIHLPCDALRDYFYVGNRRRAWDRQASLYELLRVNCDATPTELHLAFKLRALELRTGRAPTSDVRASERSFNILAHPELRACYNALLNDPASPARFPYGGFGSILVYGNCSRDSSTFYASRIFSFLPEQNFKALLVPLRKIEFYSDHAIYRDPRRKVELMFDQASLPLLWDSSWNQWKHLLGAKISVKAPFIQTGKYRHRAGAWDFVNWEAALPSRIEVVLPANIGEQVALARQTHHRFGQYAQALDQVRARIETAPVEKAELQGLCAALGIPGDFDVAQITWKPDYDAFYYKQLCTRARCLYLFRSEYIFDLENAVVVESPQLGHATYLFSKPASMRDFLAIYVNVTKDDIRRNRNNSAERLGFLGRLLHGHSPRLWMKELKTHVGEPVDYAGALG